MINLIIPMAGRGSRFSKQGYKIPKPLVQLNGKPFFWWAIESVRRSTQLSQIVCVVLREHVEEYNIIEQVRTYFPEVEFVILDDVTDGALDTAMCGLQIINNDYPIIFNDCDQAFEIREFDKYIAKLIPKGSVSAYLCNFHSCSDSYSYALYDNEVLIQTAEKKVISNFAISGAYIFANKSIVIENYEVYKKDCKYSEVFISGIYNTLCEKGHIVKGILLEHHLSFGTPEELDAAKNIKLFQTWC